MGRRPCCSGEGLNRGTWMAEEDEILARYIGVHGEGKWKTLPKRAGLKRCGKSCRLRWLNYLRPNIKRGNISEQEEDLIVRLHRLLGNRWSLIAGRLPGRTDNEIKNYWNTTLWKKLHGRPLREPKRKNSLSKTSSQPQARTEETKNHILPPPGDPQNSRTQDDRTAEVGLSEDGHFMGLGADDRSSHCDWQVEEMSDGAVFDTTNVLSLWADEGRDHETVGDIQSLTFFLGSEPEWM